MTAVEVSAPRGVAATIIALNPARRCTTRTGAWPALAVRIGVTLGEMDVLLVERGYLEWRPAADCRFLEED